jgi:hypothetical protein
MRTNLSLSNFLILASVSSSVLNFNYMKEYLMPDKIISEMKQQEDITDWKINAFNYSPHYTILDDEAEKMAIIISFSNKLMEYTVDLDNDIVDMVNENFWDLL